MTWGTHCARCGREDCRWERDGTCQGTTKAQGKPQDAFDLDQALLDCAMQNIAVRARQRRFEAIHDVILLLGITISLTIAIMAGVWCWLLVSGRV